MLTIGQLVNRYGLSRSTLIHYDKKGLLKPTGRSFSNYRLYTESDAKRLERIILFRSAGMTLSSIAAIIDKCQDEVDSALEKRLSSINKEIHHLRDQQKLIIEIIQKSDISKGCRVLTKDTWVTILSSIGLDETDMWNWHKEFEKLSPEAHQDFLESLGIEKDEITLIRKSSIQ